MILATLRAVGLGRPYPPPPEPLRRRPRACAGGCNGRQRPSLGAGCEPLPDAGTKRLLRLLVFGRLDAALTGGTSILSWASCSETVEWAILPPTIAAAPAAITLPRGLSRAQNRLPWARFPFTFPSRRGRRIASVFEQMGIKQIRRASVRICADQCMRDGLGGHSDVESIGLEHLISYSATVVLKSVSFHRLTSVRSYVIGLLGAPNAVKRRKSSVFAVKPLGRRPVR